MVIMIATFGAHRVFRVRNESSFLWLVAFHPKTVMMATGRQSQCAMPPALADTNEGPSAHLPVVKVPHYTDGASIRRPQTHITQGIPLSQSWRGGPYIWNGTTQRQPCQYPTV